MRTLLTGLMALGLSAVAHAQVDTAYTEYKAGQGVTGAVKSIGSDTMNNLMTAWGEEFRKFYPAVKVEVEGKGSSTAPPALIEGQAQFGPMSRPMKSEEVDKFEKKFGYKPTGLRVAVDALEVFVHKDNPINEVSFEQLTKIFSVDGPDMTWDQVGVADPAWKGKPISLYGRNSASGTYGYFKEHAMGKKDYKKTVKEQPGSSAVVQAVGADRFSIGYSGMGYKTADVKSVRVKKSDKDKAVAPSGEAALNGSYPLGRFLYVYVNHDARSESGLDPLRAEFIKMIYSKQGQEVVTKDGYVPVPTDIARQELKLLGIKAGF
jgi:phosphate transport system substrate-binding protein